MRRGDGERIRVRWPSGQRQIAAGSTLRVRVDQPLRGAQRLTVSLVRVSEKGRILGAVQRKGVTRGTVAVAVPKVEGRRYALRLARGSKVLRSLTLRVPKAGAPQAAAPAAPIAPGNDGSGPGHPLGNDALHPGIPLGNDILPFCLEGPASGTIELSAPSVVAGGDLAFDVLNTGSSCLTPLDRLAVERQNDAGDWESVLAMYVIPSMRPGIYAGVFPGLRDGMTFSLQPDALPGQYRVTVVISTMAPPEHADPASFTRQTATLTAPFEVTTETE